MSTVRQQGSGSTTPSSAALRFWGGFDGDAPWARKPPCAHGGPTPTPSGVPQGQSCLWHWQVRSSPLLGHCQVQGHGDHRAAQATEAPSNLNLATLELTQQGQSASRGSPRAGLARATMRRRRRACEMAPVPMGHFAARESRARSPPGPSVSGHLPRAAHWQWPWPRVAAGRQPRWSGHGGPGP